MRKKNFFYLAVVMVTLASCKKNSQVEEPVLTGCAKHAATVPKIILKGTDNVASAVELSMDTASFDTGFKYYWKLPNGSILEGSTLKIARLNMNDHRGVFYAYYKTPDSCTSFKNSIELKLGGVPCNLPENNLNVDSIPNFQNITIGNMQGRKFLENYEITTGTVFDYPVIHILLNVPTLQEGEYKMLESSSNFFPNTGTKLARFGTKLLNATDYWDNKNQESLNVVLVNGKFEVFICEAWMTNSVSKQTRPITMRLRVD